MANFLRRTWSRYPKLGKRRKKKQVWRSPKGRHNKMRRKEKAYPPVVSIGYGKERKHSGMIKGKIPIVIRNINDLKKIKSREIAIVGKIGRRNKIEILKLAKEKKIEIANINIDKFLEKNLVKEKEDNKNKSEEKTNHKENKK